jgi:hypothetical protein
MVVHCWKSRFITLDVYSHTESNQLSKVALKMLVKLTTEFEQDSNPSTKIQNMNTKNTCTWNKRAT